MIPSDLTQTTQTTGHSRAWSLLVAATLFAAPQALRAQATATPPATDTAEPDAKQTAVVPTPAPAASAAGDEEDDTIVLSPFEVVADNKGYFSSNSMSGTRLNSKIEDLGQSVTVMTKEQMSDFAMLDINDVFDHMASTEGTNTYSDFVVDRTGAVTDNVALDPNNANRVRGIGNANIAFNNVQMTGRVPVDPLWLDSVEVSRGPNANIFGLGNSSGTVNQTPATANITRNFVKVEGRVDSYGGWRTSLDVNRVLMEDKLAVRGSIAYQHTGFIREPSGEDARRLSLQAKFKPFEFTTISASWYNYKNASQRPNFTTPRDNITSWIAAGRPAWDPITRLISLDGVSYGQGTGGTLVAGSTTPITTLPTYFNGSPTDGRSIFRVGRADEDSYWTIPAVTNAATPAANPVSNNIRLISTNAVNSYGASQPLFASYAALGDKSVYDWSEYNLMAANKAWDDVDTAMAQLDQIILNTPKHMLAAQVAFLREDASRIEDLPLGPASVNGVIGEVYADPNLYNLDGTPNPYFGRPYLRSKEPFWRDRPMTWETSRAQLAYKLDFAKDSGWSKSLGTHQLLGYYEYKDRTSRHYSWRRTATSRDLQWQQDLLNAANPAPWGNRTTAGLNPVTGAVYPAAHNHMRVYELYYVGDTPGGGIEYSPRRFMEDSAVPYVWGNTGNFRYEPISIGWTPTTDGITGTQTIVKTLGGVIQSTFLDGRLVTTFGLREDEVFDHNAVPAQLNPDFTDIDYAVSNQWQEGWRDARGKTQTVSFVARPFRDFGPLRSQMNGGGIGKFFAEALTGLSVTYNESDNFIPQGPAYDLYLRPLPNQTGNSKDYGFWLSLFDGRLSIRYNHFKTDQINLRNGDVSTIAQRVLRADGMNANDRWNLLDRAGQVSSPVGWVKEFNPTWTDAQVRTETANVMGLPEETITGLEDAIRNGQLAATQDVVSEGDELEINYNPTREWTISASATKTVAINQNAGSTIEDWINDRMPIWETVEDPRFTTEDDPTGAIPTGATGHLLWRYIRGSAFTAYGYDANNSAATNFTTFVAGPLSVYRQLEGRPRPQLPKYTAKVSTRYNLSGVSDNEVLRNMTVGGALRWIDKKAIGFYGVQSLPDTITELDTNRPVYSPAETYIDLFVSYRTKLFDDKVRATIQFNVKNLTEGGDRLLVTQVFPDGSPLAYRIIDPRQFVLSTTFDF